MDFPYSTVAQQVGTWPPHNTGCSHHRYDEQVRCNCEWKEFFKSKTPSVLSVDDKTEREDSVLCRPNRLWCQWACISRSTLARKLQIEAPLSISQSARVYGVAQALDTVLSLDKKNIVKVVSWLTRTAWGLGGVASAQQLSTAMGFRLLSTLLVGSRMGCANNQ